MQLITYGLTTLTMREKVCGALRAHLAQDDLRLQTQSADFMPYFFFAITFSGKFCEFCQTMRTAKEIWNDSICYLPYLQ